jgi:hypothetical protein
MGAPWTAEQQDAAVTRGPHPSAKHQHTTFILEDMYDYVRMGYWLVLPYSALHGHPQLKIAPAGVVPQRERRPRPIMDYTFNSVNPASIPIAPTHAMQFGPALQRILQRLAYCNPIFGPPLLAKIDLADGYYRVPLTASAALNLAVVLPPDPSIPYEPLLGIPLSLPMGWRDSPPFFCAFTETCTDLANAVHVDNPIHPFSLPTSDTMTETHPFNPRTIWPYNSHLPTHPLNFTDVYMDDFMMIAQAPTHTYTRNNLLYHLDSIFRDTAGTPRRTIVSASKVLKVDATFATQKRILGWDINTTTMEIQLPQHRVERLAELIQYFTSRIHTTRTKWQKLLGELRSMALAIHSAKYLFSALQYPLVHSSKRRFRIPAIAKSALHDWKVLLHSLGSHPVPITMTVPHAPHFWAATDASVQGLGGFWLPATITNDSQPYVWRHKLPSDIQARLISSTNPSGDLTVNDFELAAAVLGHATQLHTTIPKPFSTTITATDNTAAASWLLRGSTSNAKPPAYLLRQLAQDCRTHNSSLNPIFAPGTTNTIADFLSRSFHLSDGDLLMELQHNYPIQPPWKLATPPAHSTYSMNLGLSKRSQPMEYHPPVHVATTPHGQYGLTSASPCLVTHSSSTWTIPCRSSSYSLHDTGWARWLPPTMQSKLEQWKAPFVPLGRRSPHWDTKTPDYSHPADWISDYTGNSKHIPNMTPHRVGSNQSLFSYSCKLFNTATARRMPANTPLAR